MKQYTPNELTLNTQYLFSIDESMGGYPQGVFLATPLKREIKDFEVYENIHDENSLTIHSNTLHLDLRIDKVLNDGEKHWLRFEGDTFQMKLFPNEWNNIIFIEDSSEDNIKDLFFNSNYFLPQEYTPLQVKEYFYSQWSNDEDGLKDSFNMSHSSESWSCYDVNKILHKGSEYSRIYELPIVHDVQAKLSYRDDKGNLQTPTFIVRRSEEYGGKTKKDYIFFSNSNGEIRETPYIM